MIKIISFILVFYLIHFYLVSWRFNKKIIKTVLSNVHEDLYSLSKDILETLHKENIKVWAIGGTALGIARNNEIIPWDDDVDFGCMQEEELKLKNLHWGKDIRLNRTDLGYQFFRKGVNFDLFFCRLNNDIIEYSDSKTRGFYPKETIMFSKMYPLKYMKFGDLLVPVVNDLENQLKRSFGDSFMEEKIGLGKKFHSFPIVISKNVFLWKTNPFLNIFYHDKKL